MNTTVPLDQFVRLVAALNAVRSSVRALRRRRLTINPDLLDVLRLADTTATAGAARGCFAIAKAEVELLGSLNRIADGSSNPADHRALRITLLGMLKDELGPLRQASDAELGAYIRALLRVHDAGELDALDRMANDVANEIAITVAER